jgi:hypothetical protein
MLAGQDYVNGSGNRYRVSKEGNQDSAVVILDFGLRILDSVDCGLQIGNA